MLRRSPSKSNSRVSIASSSGAGGELKSQTSVRTSQSSVRTFGTSSKKKRISRSGSTLRKFLSPARGNDALQRKSDVALVDSDTFTVLISAIVFANVVCIGLETEMHGDFPQLFSFINNGFLLFYLTEICFRLITHGVKAFREAVFVVDVAVVLIAFIDRMASSRAMARALPTLRLGRLFRVLRSSNALKYSRELWIMVESFRTGALSLFWMSIVLFVLLWATAGFATDAVGSSAEWASSMNPSLDNTLDPFRPFDLNEYFGSISRSFLTLFQVVTLSQWSNVARPLINAYPVLVVFFVAFLFTTTYGLLETVVANLVVDSMIQSKQNDKAVSDHLRETRRKAGTYALRVLAVADLDGDGELNVDELAYALDELGLDQILVDLGVPVTNAANLIRMFDRNGDKQVSYKELVEGAVVMDEKISHRDYVKLALWLQNLMSRIELLETRLERLVSAVKLQRLKLQAAFEELTHTMYTADETILRQRALQTIRTQNTPEPAKLQGVQMFVPKSEGVIREETVEFLSFARRFLGDAIPQLPETLSRPAVEVDIPGAMPPVGEPPALADGLRFAARASGLPPAPPQQHVWREQAERDRDRAQVADKYVAHFGQPSASTLHLRDTINRDRPP